MNPHFTTDGHTYYPANTLAVSICDEMKRIKLSDTDIIMLRAMGHDPRLTNGKRIGGVDINV